MSNYHQHIIYFLPTAEVRHVQRHPAVKIAEFDQCVFGLRSIKTKTPIKKRTRVLTNSDHLWKALNGKYCAGDHAHQVISGSEGGQKRSVAAQVYPDPLIQAISKALIQEERDRS